MSCKVYLVPEDVINTWRAEQRASVVDKPINTVVSQVDSTIGNILNKDMSDYDKEKLHSQELAKYMTIRNQNPVTDIQYREQKSSLDIRDMMTSIPKMYRPKAAELLKYLQSDEDVEWDDQGQVSIGKQKISRSHILDLIHDAMRLRKKVSRPKGWRNLSSHLIKRNMPKAFLGNPEWSNEWSTPPESPVKEINTEKGPSFVPFRKDTAAATPMKKQRKSKIAGIKKIKGWTTVKDWTDQK